MINRSINRWWTVFAGVMGSAVGAGTIMVYAYGILAAAMGDELRWDRSILGANMTAFLIGTGFGSVSLGALISKFGIRGPAALYAATFGLLFAAAAIAPPVPMIFNLLFFVAGIGGAACTAMPYSVAISGYFDRRRGLALGIVVAGSGLGATFVPQIAQQFVSGAGWRSGFLTIGLITALVSVLGIVLLVRTPAGVVRADTHTAAERPSSFGDVLATRHFWIITLAIAGVSIATFGGMASLVPLFKDARISSVTIAAILSVAGLASWVARPIVGYLLDKIFAPYLCAAIFALAGLGLLILTTSSATMPAYLGASFIALAMGSEADLVTFLVSRYFRLIDFSRVVGLIWVVWAWGGGIGTLIVAQTYKMTKSYHMAFVIFTILLIVAGIVLALIGPYLNPPGRADDSESALRRTGCKGSLL